MTGKYRNHVCVIVQASTSQGDETALDYALIRHSLLANSGCLHHFAAAVRIPVVASPTDYFFIITLPIYFCQEPCKYSFVIYHTCFRNTKTPVRFGMAISALKISHNCQTASKLIVHPIPIIKIYTHRYTTMARRPHKYCAHRSPKENNNR